MGIKTLGNSQPCDICGLEISVSEYVLFHIGWDIDGNQRKRDQNERKMHCENWHTKLRELEKQRLYDYSRSFVNNNG